jgi:16S rRNA G1207 methylase RsmC
MPKQEAPAEGWSEDFYFKKRLSYSLHRQQYLFDTAELLFSTDEVDLGTQLLLRSLLDAAPPAESILDIGCGYGPIGIVLARQYPQAQVLLCDKDLLAVRYARHNIALNQVPNASAVGSIGVHGLPPQTFDLILSNIPGHIGERAIQTDFLHGPAGLLSPRGSYWCVVVTPLAELVQRTCQEHSLPLQEPARRKGHSVFRIGPPV